MIHRETPEVYHQLPEGNGSPRKSYVSAAELQGFPIPHSALFLSIFQPQGFGFFQ